MSTDPTFFLHTDFHTDPPTVTMEGVMNQASMYLLCEEIGLLVDYYMFNAVNLHISSEGGDLQCMETYLRCLYLWKDKRNLAISTLGMGNVNGVGAFIVSLGDIGRRRAYSSTRFTYFIPGLRQRRGIGFASQGRPTTAEDLKCVHLRVLKCLAHHVSRCDVSTGNVPGGGDSSLRKSIGGRNSAGEILLAGLSAIEHITTVLSHDRAHFDEALVTRAYQVLTESDASITAETAAKMRLIDQVTMPFPRVEGDRYESRMGKSFRME